MYPSTPLTAEQRDYMHARARRQAQVLREAAIDDFWRGVYTLGARALRAARRALRRTGTVAAAAAARTTNGGGSPVSHNPSGV